MIGSGRVECGGMLAADLPSLHLEGSVGFIICHISFLFYKIHVIKPHPFVFGDVDVDGGDDSDLKTQIHTTPLS